MRSKKGSTLVEATIVIPLVILTLISLILIINFMYSQVRSNAKNHINTISVSGEVYGNLIRYGNVPEGVITEKRKGILIDTYESTSTINFKKGGFLTKSFQRETMCKGYGIDEKKYIRSWDLGK